MVNFTLNELLEEQAKEICSWIYEGEYSIYNFSDWDTVVKNGWDLSVESARKSEFVSVLLDNELVAYGRISLRGNKVLIGIGLKPSLCGKGYGASIMRLLIEECRSRFPNKIIALEVRSFNKRAIKCYKSIGFETRDKYIKKTFNNSEDEFYYMEYV